CHLMREIAAFRQSRGTQALVLEGRIFSRFAAEAVGNYIASFGTGRRLPSCPDFLRSIFALPERHKALQQWGRTSVVGRFFMRKLISRLLAWGVLFMVVVFVTITPICVVADALSQLADRRSHSTSLSGAAARAMIQRQFIAFDPNYLEQKKLFAPKITAAAEE